MTLTGFAVMTGRCPRRHPVVQVYRLAGGTLIASWTDGDGTPGAVAMLDGRDGTALDTWCARCPPAGVVVPFDPVDLYRAARGGKGNRDAVR